MQSLFCTSFISTAAALPIHRSACFPTGFPSSHQTPDFWPFMQLREASLPLVQVDNLSLAQLVGSHAEFLVFLFFLLSPKLWLTRQHWTSAVVGWRWPLQMLGCMTLTQMSSGKSKPRQGTGFWSCPQRLEPSSLDAPGGASEPTQSFPRFSLGRSHQSFLLTKCDFTLVLAGCHLSAQEAVGLEPSISLWGRTCCLCPKAWLIKCDPESAK